MIKKEIERVSLYDNGMKSGFPFFDEYQLYLLMNSKSIVKSKREVDCVVTAYRPSTDTIHVFKINPKEILAEEQLVEYKEVSYINKDNDVYVYHEEATSTDYRVNNVSFPVMMHGVEYDTKMILIIYDNQPVFVIEKDNPNKQHSAWFAIDAVKPTNNGIFAIATVKQGIVKNGMTFMVIDERNRSFAYNYVMTDLYKPKQQGETFEFKIYQKWDEETYDKMSEKYIDCVVQPGFIFEHIYGAHQTRQMINEDLDALEKKALVEGLSNDTLLRLGRGFKNQKNIKNHFKNTIDAIEKECGEIPHAINPRIIKSFGRHKIIHLILAIFLLLPMSNFIFDGNGGGLSVFAWFVMIIAGFRYKKFIGALIAAVGGYIYIELVDLLFPIDYGARFALIALFLYLAYKNYYHEKDLREKHKYGRRDERIKEVGQKIAKVQAEADQFGDMILAKIKEGQAKEQEFFKVPYKRALYQGILNPKEESKAYAENMELYNHACNLEHYYTYTLKENVKGLIYCIPNK